MKEEGFYFVRLFVNVYNNGNKKENIKKNNIYIDFGFYNITYSPSLKTTF